MIKHILLPIDLTDPPKNLIHNAIFICKKADAKLSILHVYNIANTPTAHGAEAGAAPVQPYDHYFETEMMMEKKTIVDKNIHQLREEIPELNEVGVRFETALGMIAEEIGNNAEKRNADLIVMETSGASGLKEFFIGTHSEEATRKAPCPVLIFPKDYRVATVRNICIAVDDSIEDFHDKLTAISDFTSLYEANVHIIHVEEKPEKPVLHDQLEEALKRVFWDKKFTFNIIKNEDVEESIQKFSESNQVDLLGLIYHEHNFFYRLRKKSTTTNLIYHSDIPLIILK